MPPRPYGWMRIMIGLGVFAASTAICLMNVDMFLKVRPINLRDQTALYNHELLETLHEAGIEPEAILSSEPQIMKDDHASWTWQDFTVNVPPEIDRDEVLKAIKVEAVKMGTSPVVTPASDGKPIMQVSLGTRVFVVMHFQQVLPEPPVDELPVPEFDGPPFFDDEQELPPWLPSLLMEQEDSGISPPLMQSAPPAEDEELLLEPLAQAAGPRVAIIIDDGGYGGDVTNAVLDLDPRLTLSILPGAPHAQYTAERAVERGFEIMLHMPMDDAQVPYTLTDDMSPQTIAQKVNEAVTSLPGAKGINNHMGSVFTANKHAMDAFFTALKDLPLYFVDSRTTDKTLAHATAEAVGIPVASRNVFLDNETSPESIRKQIDHLIDLALEQGQAIGICHFRPTTVALLADVLPQLKGKGVELVHASQLVQ